MEGARGGPRSAAELAEAARGLNELLDVGLITKEGYDAQFAALQAETDALLLRGRGRSSIGDAGSPVPTTASAATAAPVSAGDEVVRWHYRPSRWRRYGAAGCSGDGRR